MKIVLATDFSKSSENAVEAVLARPWSPDTSFYVLHVVDLFVLTSSIGYLESFIEKETAESKKLCQSIVERFRAKGNQAELTILEGYPQTAIVDFAKDQNADFVMLGSHGHTALSRFLVGSVARSVLQHAHCSVEIVRARAADSATRPMKILLAVDGSPHSMAAAQSVARRNWPEMSEVRVISVVDPGVPAMDHWYWSGEVAMQLRDSALRLGETAVEAAQKILAGCGLRTDGNVLTGGGAKWRVLDDAKDWGADLIVVGSHGRRGVKRLLLGSVSESVALHAECSVDVIRDASLLHG
jgi:nucleotide-binding universal stress UspA family protein